MAIQIQNSTENGSGIVVMRPSTVLVVAEPHQYLTEDGEPDVIDQDMIGQNVANGAASGIGGTPLPAGRIRGVYIIARGDDVDDASVTIYVNGVLKRVLSQAFGADNVTKSWGVADANITIVAGDRVRLLLNATMPADNIIHASASFELEFPMPPA